MIEKIVSGGQTGADQGALDAAIELGIPHGGWIPKGRLTESGRLPEKYRLQEMATDSYPARTLQNVLDSDGTLIVSHGKLMGGSAYTREMARKHGKPCVHIDLEKTSGSAAVKAIRYWIERHDIRILNVAGPRRSKDPRIYGAVKRLLISVFHLGIVRGQMPDPARAHPLVPATVEEAVQDLVSVMSLRDKTAIGRMKREELGRLQPTLGRYIRTKYGLWSVNRALMESCRARADTADLNVEDISRIIITALWEELRRTHRLRVLKGNTA